MPPSLENILSYRRFFVQVLFAQVHGENGGIQLLWSTSS